MRKIWDFHGGIHPDENKTESTQRSIERLPLPAQLVIPLQQHIGAPAIPSVAVGEQVKKGQMIAEAQGFISAFIHAPTSGVISAIEPRTVAHPSAMEDLCIVLETDGLDEWVAPPLQRDHTSLSIPEILDIVRNSGVAGMGGAGFPTEVKLHPPKHDKVRTLILNAAECEPYITADDMLMRERADQVIKGMEIMARVLAPENCIIGIEDNKPEAAQALIKAAVNTLIEVVVIPTKYPSGGEKQLIKILTGCEVPSGAIPADIGIMCQNVATAVAVYRAVTYGEPLISRITTVTGAATHQPGNYEVLIGTPISALLSHARVDLTKLNRLIMGGPMMGFALHSTRSPIVKTSNCILASTQDELSLPPPAQACIRCGFCVEACPMELLPQQLFWFAQSSNWEQAENYNISDCIECGACSYVCPSAIPLVQHYRYAKSEIRKQKQEQSKSDRARERFEFRLLRQQREKDEKEANRKARAEAAAKVQAEKRALEAQPKAASVDSKSEAIAAAIARSTERKASESTPKLVNLTDSTVPSTPTALDDTISQIAQLEDQLAKARTKCETMQQALDEARENGSDTDKLERALNKNMQRLQMAVDALSLARPPLQSSSPAKIEVQRVQLNKESPQ